MEMRKTLLEKCEEVIDNTSWPFIKNNLKTSKIFNDLVQFHAHDSGDLSKPLTLDVSSKGKLPIGRKGSQKPAISTRSGVTGLTGMSPSKKSGMHSLRAARRKKTSPSKRRVSSQVPRSSPWRRNDLLEWSSQAKSKPTFSLSTG